MVRFIDGNNIAAMVRQNQQQANSAPIGYSSVTQGGLRIASAEGLTVEGSQSISGTSDISGTQNVSGTHNVSGVQNVSGTQNQTGPINVNGAYTGVGAESHAGTQTYTGNETHAGTLGYTGNETHVGNESHAGTLTYTGNESHSGTTLNYTGNEAHSGTEEHHGNVSIYGNLAITGGGNITAGVLTIDNGGTYGGRILSSATLELDALTTIVNDLHASNTVFGHTSVESDNDVIAYGSLKSPNIGTTTNSANVYVNGSGFLIEVTSARRFKKQIRLAKLDPRLLDVRVRDWADKFDTEGPRVTGVIAEEVEAAGGAGFVGHDAEGKPKSVAYDRFVLARTQLLNEKLDAEVAALRAEMAELRKLITK